MKPLFLDWNLGLGDAIICNGLVRSLSAQDMGRRKIVLPCWERNLPTVRHMFSDLANVFVVQAEGEKPNVASREYETRSIGLNNPNWGMIQPWDRAFYVFAGVPFDAKWDMFHVPESGTELSSRGGTILGHEDVSRGFAIDLKRATLITSWICDPSMLLTDWRYVIRDAKEIHCIDSAPMHLAELLPTTGKLFYHKYARAANSRNPVDATFRKPWVVLE
jgi:hypothetical protein